MGMLARFRHDLLRARRGAAALEFAIIGPTLVLLATGMYDYGSMLWRQMEVSNAARVGAAHVTKRGWDVPAIMQAVREANNNTAIIAAPAPNLFCGCTVPTTGIVAATCASSCPNGDIARQYVTVNAMTQYHFATPLPGRAGSITLRATTVARLQ